MSDTWERCYDEGWKGAITPDAFRHPAKFSRGLIRRIYQHITDEGWVREGDTILDPFGGVALGGLDAMLHGLNWVGVELEQKFVDLGRLNIGLWNYRYTGKMNAWGSARLIEGDSRQLLQVIGQAQGVVSSPPWGDESEGVMRASKFKDPAVFAELQKDKGHGSSFEAKLRAMYADDERADYGSTPGNLGNMRATSDGLKAVVSSPPYTDGAQHTGGNDTHPEHIQGGTLRLPGIAGAISSPPYAESMDHAPGNKNWQEMPTENQLRQGNHGYSGQVQKTTDYGSTPGQLGAMRADGFAGAVSSPPYEKANQFVDGCTQPLSHYKKTGGAWKEYIHAVSPGQMQEQSGDDFWTAARLIVDQVYLALAPGAHAVFVVKSFVKNKALVDFPGQWRQMCEAAGFITLHEHHALLVKDKGTQIDLDGNHHAKKVERKSFFRRLAEKNGSPHIDFETIYCMRKDA